MYNIPVPVYFTVPVLLDYRTQYCTIYLTSEYLYWTTVPNAHWLTYLYLNSTCITKLPNSLYSIPVSSQYLYYWSIVLTVLHTCVLIVSGKKLHTLFKMSSISCTVLFSVTSVSTYWMTVSQIRHVWASSTVIQHSNQIICLAQHSSWLVPTVSSYINYGLWTIVPTVSCD